MAQGVDILSFAPPLTVRAGWVTGHAATLLTER